MVKTIARERIANGRYWLRYRGERLAFVIGCHGRWNVERLDNRLLGCAKTLDDAERLAQTLIRNPA